MSVYACSDFHGMYDLWKQVQDFLKEDDTLYFLGDAADRGPDGYKIMKKLLVDKRVIYLKGNHENFFVKGIVDYLALGDMNYDLWTFGNGGWDTYLKAIEDDSSILGSVYYQIFKLPFFDTYTNKNGQKIYLSHAGCDPDKFYNSTEKDLVWDRNHLYHQWPQDKEYENVFMVHGHTPTPILRNSLTSIANFTDKEKNFVNNHGAIFYCDGHKIDIDCGSFATNATVLLNLDTFKTFPIKSANMTEDQAKLLYS